MATVEDHLSMLMALLHVCDRLPQQTNEDEDDLSVVERKMMRSTSGHEATVTKCEIIPRTNRLQCEITRTNRVPGSFTLYPGAISCCKLTTFRSESTFLRPQHRGPQSADIKVQFDGKVSGVRRAGLVIQTIRVWFGPNPSYFAADGITERDDVMSFAFPVNNTFAPLDSRTNEFRARWTVGQKLVVSFVVNHVQPNSPVFTVTKATGSYKFHDQDAIAITDEKTRMYPLESFASLQVHVSFRATPHNNYNGIDYPRSQINSRVATTTMQLLA